MVDEKLDPELERITQMMDEEEQNGVADVKVGDPVTAEHAPRSGPGKRRPPVRRRKGMQEVSATAGAPPAATVASAAVASAPTALAELDEGGTGTKDAMIVWPRVLEKQKSLGYEPEAIGISVARVRTGPMKAPKEQLAPIDGSIVAGDDKTSPGEALFDYIVNYYHLGSDIGGPAVYHLAFYYRAGGGTIRGSAELPLGHPNDLIRQRQAAEKAKFDRAVSTGSIPAGTQFPGMPARTPFGFPIPAAPTIPAASPNLNAQENQQLHELLRKVGYYEGRAEAQAAMPAAPAPTSAAPPAKDPNAKPPGLSDEEWSTIQRQRIAKDMGPAIAQAVTATLVGMGFTPELIQGLRQAPVPVPMVTAQGQVPPPTPMSVFKDAVDLLKAVRGFQTQIDELAPGSTPAAGEDPEKPKEEEDETKLQPIAGGLAKYENGQPVLFAKKGEEEGTMEYWTRLAMGNQPLFEKLASKIPPDVFGRILETIASRRAAAPPAPGAAPTQAPPDGNPQPKQVGWQPG